MKALLPDMAWDEQRVPALPVRSALAGLAVVALICAAGWLTAVLSEPSPLRQGAAPQASSQHALAFSASLALLIVGIFYLSFWLARREEREHLLLAITTVVWAVFNLQYVLPAEAQGVATHAAQRWQVAATQLLPIPWLNWLIYLFIAHLTPQRRPRWLERLLPGYVFGFSVAVMPLWPLVERWPMLPVWAYTLFGIMSVATIAVMVAALGRTERRVIQVACLYCIAAAAHDLMLRQGWLAPDRIALIPYTGLALLGSFTFTLQRRYVAALAAEERAQAQLSLKLAQREQELHRQHQRVLQLERERTEQRERQRLMRDLHDGVGGLLTTSLMLAEQGCMSRDDLVDALRQAVDDLRTTIDVLQPAVQDLGELLANFRHRIGPRLQAAGVELVWELSPGIDRLRFTPEQKLHLLRWLQEALTNALRHARPQRLCQGRRVSAGPLDGGCVRPHVPRRVRAPGAAVKAGLTALSRLMGSTCQLGPCLVSRAATPFAVLRRWPPCASEPAASGNSAWRRSAPCCGSRPCVERSRRG